MTKRQQETMFGTVARMTRLLVSLREFFIDEDEADDAETAGNLRVIVQEIDGQLAEARHWLGDAVIDRMVAQSAAAMAVADVAVMLEDASLPAGVALSA